MKPETVLVLCRSDDPNERIRNGVRSFVNRHQPGWSASFLDPSQSWAATLAKTNPIGIIAQAWEPSTIAALRDWNGPLVTLGDSPIDAVNVREDHWQCGHLAVSEMQTLGHRHFLLVHIGRPLTTTWLENFHNGARAALNSHSTLKRFWIPIDSDWHADLEIALSQFPRPFSALCVSDRDAIHVIRAAQKSGLAVPADISIVAFENRDICQYTVPPLSSLSIDYVSIGYYAGLRMDKLVRGKTPPRSTKIIASHLVHRESTVMPTGLDPDLAQTVASLRSDPNQCNGVVEFARIMGCSRRQLELRVRRAFGLSPLQLLHHLRVRRARDLLVESQATIHDISTACGFGSIDRFRKMFRKLVGSTPASFRKKSARTQVS